jgi:hypothetical protein
LGEGTRGHSPCRGDGRALQEHGESNWGGAERVRVGVELGGRSTLCSDDLKDEAWRGC